MSSQRSYTTVSCTTWDVHRQMSHAFLCFIMLITILKIIETPETMLGAVQLGIQQSVHLSTCEHDLAIGYGNSHLQNTFDHLLYVILQTSPPFF